MSILLTGGAGYIGSHTWLALAQQKLGWQAHRSLAEMCADAWRWQSQNPDGYE